MDADSVKFYEKMKDLQNKQHERESRNVELEREFNSQINTDKRVRHLRAVELQKYWKKLCEDEKKSQWRNEQLLKDLERLEANMAAMSAKTDRLRHQKKQYEDHIEMLYPQWKERVQAMVKYREQTEEEDELRRTIAVTMPTLPPEAPITRPSAGQYMQHPAGQYMQHPAGQHMQYPAGYQTDPYAGTRQYNYDRQDGRNDARYVSNPQQRAPVVENFGNNTLGSTLQTVPSMPYAESNEQSLPPPPQEFNNDAASAVERRQSADAVQPAHASQQPTHAAQQHVSAVIHPPPPEHQAGARNNESVGMYADVDDKTDDDLSDIDDQEPTATPRSMATPASLATPRSMATPRSARSDLHYPAPDVTLQGMYNLLVVVQEAVKSSVNRDEFYQAITPAPTVKKDIIDNANKEATLSHVAPESVSLVVLEQLPLLAYSCEGSCVLNDKLLQLNVQDYDSTRSHIHRIVLPFWDRLHAHFTALIQYQVFTADRLADMFAPHLITPQSLYEDQAKDLLRALYRDIPVDIPSSPTSTNTASLFNSPARSAPQGNGLNESSFYQQMAQQSGDYEDSDSEDEIEKQLAITASPRNVVSTHHDSVSESSELLSSRRSTVASPRIITSVASTTTGPLSPTGMSAKILAKSKIPDFMDSSSDEDVGHMYNTTGPSEQERRKTDEEDDFEDFYS